MRSFAQRWSVSGLIAAGSCICLIRAAAAQPVQPAPKTGPRPPVNGPAAPGAAPNTPQPPATPSSPSASPSAPAPVDDKMMAAVNGGITAEQVAGRAAQTSYQAKAAEESSSAASARSEAAWTNYIPRVGLVARYTRLSNFSPPSLGSGSIVATPAPPNTLNPTPTIAEGFTFPLVLNNWLGQATIAIPISDYFLRINESYSALLHQEDAARFDIQTARAKSYSDGKIAYFTWLRARGSLTVAEQSLAVAQAHLKDSENQFAVGNASKADVLRAQTAVASAELGVERGKTGITVTERQIRIATHAKEDEKLEPGESLESPLAPAPGNLKGLVSEALGARPEIKSIDRNADAARKQANVARAGKFPVVSGFGDVTYANPNQRRFPAANEWFPTWSLGAQVTWSPNDYLAAAPQAQDAESRAASLDAQKGTIRDGIDLEVTQAYTSLLESDTAIGTTTRQLESAEEGYRVARELFNAGRGTATTLIDAETALAQARFEHLNAKVDARLARIRLEHAIGRDVK